ncbi:class Ib ribonucleoside-diphosphate reductase assembly flavoprotein NrdI [Paenibacillus alvei]|uniref:class Ib ribonucleoside-diphosphate reductase assembly flavoprotein NrdI n=1 Tax=Paenibacillus alvei TaxID=44250 RepID=UPI000288A6D5|nr:class Ib ribonucleoside-diphosphate reductase assembly flavoprotein NrdI [Paenibacillus alvei]EJW13901.1 protein NrdI [Paenibacillus alvei DSM 29]MCY9544836.1 class Ib ribonucleoside-diphosphate reductase assembly flavoprotein NrdI [Paenibacillus alvei]MCY9707734.1 class Ib ribonucleoside-diphosphate reductase assembly flavoprotein NrdI [Paenibacillus alvei]MCY9757715.1 class Ib ribonucleoside-diphosphate reductase assembly flavoprotein NrdI [Paenibacillus alvei]MEC0082753.1 class Ib ribonu
MLIVYASKTGQVQRFVDRLNMKAIKIDDTIGIVDEPFVLITYTTGFGEVPAEVSEFLRHNKKNLVAVCASGNRNWKENFARAANKISYLYNVPILLKFELQGDDTDTENFKERVHKLNEVYRAK